MGYDFKGRWVFLMSIILEGVDLPKGDEKLKIEIEPDGTVWIDQGSE